MTKLNGPKTIGVIKIHKHFLTVKLTYQKQYQMKIYNTKYIFTQFRFSTFVCIFQLNKEQNSNNYIFLETRKLFL